MLTQPLLEKLTSLGLSGFRIALEEQRHNPQYAQLAFEDRFALPATIEDLDLSTSRGLDRSQILELAQAQWVPRALNVIVLGPTGAGKTYLTCALGQAACRQDFTGRYGRTSRLLHELHLARADGSYPKLLICDDWLRDPLTPAQARDLLEILDDRRRQRFACNVPVADRFRTGYCLAVPLLLLWPVRHPYRYATAGARLARPDPQPYPRRCHPRPAGAQCLSSGTERRFDAQSPFPIIFISQVTV